MLNIIKCNKGGKALAHDKINDHFFTIEIFKKLLLRHLKSFRLIMIIFVTILL